MSQIGNHSGSNVRALDTSQMMQGLEKNISELGKERPDSVKGQRVPSHPKDIRQEGQQKLPKGNVHLKRLSTLGAGLLASLRAIGAVGTLGLSELVVRQIRNAVRNHGTDRTAAMSVKITLPQDNQRSVNLDGSVLPKRIPKGMTADQLRQQIQDKVNHGHELLQQIKNGTHDGSPCSVKDMTDIMFFLKTTAESCGDRFAEGALSIPDPGNKIRQFLDSCPQSYQRESSHIGDFQSQDGGRHRGIDVHGQGSDVEKCLPDHHKTLLYGSMQKNPDMEMHEDRLYMKMEPFGAFLTSPKGGGDAGGPTRQASYHDASAILGHTFSYFATRGQGSAAGTRKERIPDTVKNDYKALMEAATGQAKTDLENHKPLSTAGGIRVMLANIAEARKSDIPDTLKESMAKFEQKMKDTYRQLDGRIGNEVMLSTDEMGI